VVLLFTSPECGPCTDLLPEIGRWHDAHSEEFTISLVSHLSAEENRAKIAEHGLEDNVLLQRDWGVAETHGTETTPSALLIRSDGTIGSPLVKGSDAVEDLMAHVIAGHTELPMLYPNGAAPQGPKVGEPAPEIGLPDLEGERTPA
jgi:hypothetical protein